MRECSFEQLPHLLYTVLRLSIAADTLRLLTNAFHLLSLISAHERISAYSMYPISMTQLIDLGSLRLTLLSEDNTPDFVCCIKMPGVSTFTYDHT